MKKLTLIIALMVPLLFSISGNAQVFQHGFNPYQICERPSLHAQDLFSKALDTARQYAQIPPIQFCRNPYIQNAAAFNLPVQSLPFQPPQIVYRVAYNPTWMAQVDMQVNNDWAIIGIFAHELGHIEHFSQLNNPFVPSQQAWLAMSIPQEKELRADEFAGFVLGHMGASSEDVVDVQRTIFTLHDNAQYANSLTRLRRMFLGYASSSRTTINTEDIQDIIDRQQELRHQFARWFQ